MKATVTMKTELPTYQNSAFSFRQMFAVIMEDFSRRVSFGIAACQHMTAAQMALVQIAINTMDKAVKLVAHGENDIFGMEMLVGQLDCQQAIEDSCRYDFNKVSAHRVAHHEMYLHFLKTAVEVVDLVTVWMINKNDNDSKRQLAATAQLMAQCFILYKFVHVPSNYVTHGTMIRVMPLMRFQPTGTESLDQAIGDYKKHAELQHTTNEAVLHETRSLYMLHHSMWMVPLKSRLDQAYMTEIAKYN